MTGEQYISELLSKYSSLTWSISLVSNMNDCFLIHANSAQKKKKTSTSQRRKFEPVVSFTTYMLQSTTYFVTYYICYNLLHMLQLTTYAIWSKYYLWKVEESFVRPAFLTVPRFIDCKVCVLVSCWDQSLYLKTHDFDDVMQVEALEPTSRTGK